MFSGLSWGNVDGSNDWPVWMVRSEKYLAGGCGSTWAQISQHAATSIATTNGQVFLFIERCASVSFVPGLNRCSEISRLWVVLTDRKLVFRHPADLDAARVKENWFLVSIIMFDCYQTQAGGVKR